MTNKSLSKQICEMCGIKPEIIQDYELNDIEVYPNFEDNNNFVKLLEIIHNKIGLSDFFLLMRYDNNPLKTELLYLINELLNKRLGYRVILVTGIKKIIKETNWEY